MLRENASNFEFQARTEAAAPNSDATIFSAFAIKEGEDTVEVIIKIVKAILGNIYNLVSLFIYNH